MGLEQKKHLFVFLSCLVVVFSFKLDVLHLGYFWDEMDAYVGPAIALSEGSLWNVLPGFHPAEMFYGHPPFLFLLLASAFKLFGQSPFVAHIVTVFFAALGVFGTYRLTYHLAGFREGVLAALLLFFSPIYFAQSAICTADIFVATLSVWVVYYYLKNKLFAAATAGVILAMTKLTALGIFASILLYECILALRTSRIDFKRFATLLLPLAVSLIFLTLQWATTGRLVPNDYFNSRNFFSDFNISQILSNSSSILRFIFFDQARFITSIFLLFLVFRKSLRTATPILIFSIIILFYTISFSTMFFLIRYITLLFPFYFAIISILICTEIQTKYLANALALAISATFLFLGINYSKNDGRIDATMQYADFVRVHQQAARYMEDNYNDIILLSDPPFSNAVRNTNNGYVLHHTQTVTTNILEANTAAFFTKPNKQTYPLTILQENGFTQVNIFTVGHHYFIILRKVN